MPRKAKEAVVVNMEQVVSEVKVPKRRGRKPKGGKVVEIGEIKNNDLDELPNIIVQFRCKLKDVFANTVSQPMSILNDNIDCEFGANLIEGCNTLDAAAFSEKSESGDSENRNDDPIDNIENLDNTTEYQNIGHKKQLHVNVSNINIVPAANHFDLSHSIIKKTKELEWNMHNNELNGKRSYCFWDTCSFDSQIFYIPKAIDNRCVTVYGSFCSLNCALAYLNQENIDDSTKFDRRQMLYHVYQNFIDQGQSVKPSPSPFYTLDKYYGNLSIQEWRQMLTAKRILLVVDKPMTHELPEVFLENKDKSNNKQNSINTPLSGSGDLKNTFAIKKQHNVVSKNDIVAAKFGIQQ